MSYSWAAWARHASGASAEERHVQELLPRTVCLLALSCMGDHWMMGYDGGKKQPARNGNVRGISNQEIPTNIMWYLDIFGCVKKLGNMMIGIEVTNPHAVWKKLVSKSWWKGTFMGNPSIIVLIVLWVKGRHVMSWVFLKSAKPVSWCGDGGSSGSCWWLNY